jgi:hypothetical protein
MNMVSRAGKLSLPARYRIFLTKRFGGKCAPPGTDTRRTFKYLAWRYDRGGGQVITLLANLLQMRPHDADEAVAIYVTGFFCNARSATEKRFAQ